MRVNEHPGTRPLPPSRRAQGFLLAAGLALLFLAPAAPAGADAPPERNSRYLFIVDTSFSMDRIKSPTQQAMFDLLDGGMAGWMRDGDTYGLWTFGSHVNTDFPMQTWEAKRKKALAALAWDHIRKQRFEKQGPFAPVLADMAAVVRSAQDVTVIILTDGDEPLKGTRFDTEINAAMKKAEPKLHAAKRPVIIALVARAGQLVWWGVNSTEQFVPLPKPVSSIQPTDLASQPVTNAVARATAPTNSLPATQKPTIGGATPSSPPPLARHDGDTPTSTNRPVVPAAKPTKPPRESIIITRESIGVKPAPPPTEPALALAEAKPTETTNLPPSIASTNPTPVAMATNLPSARLSASALAEPAHPLPALPATNLAAAQSSKPVENEPAPADKPGEVPRTPWKWFLFGAAVCAVPALTAFVWWRRRENIPEPSLITRSMARNGMLSSPGFSRQDRPSAKSQQD